MLAIVIATRTCMGFQFQAVPAVAPLLQADLGLSFAQLGVVIGIYLAPGVVFALPGGELGRRVGERRLVIVSLALMAVGGLVTAQSGGFVTAAGGRLIAGVGAVLMNILLARMVADWFTERELATAMAATQGAWPIGLGLATALLGVVATATSWRTSLLTTVVAAVAGAIVIGLFYREAPRRESTAPAARAKRLTRREMSLAAAAGLAWGFFNACPAVLAAFGQELLMSRGVGIGEAGAVVSLAIWISMVSVPLGGVLADRLQRPNTIIVAGTVAAAIATAALPVIGSPSLGFVLVGLTIGIAPGAIMALLPKVVRAEVLTTGLGVLYTVFYLVLALSQPAAGRVRQLADTPAAPVVFAAAMMLATLLGLVLFRAAERAGAQAPSTQPSS